MIQRGHAPRKLIWRFVSEIGRYAKAQMLRRRCHGGDQQRGVVHRNLHCAAHSGIGAGTEHVVNAQHVGKKDAVEQARL